MTAHTSTASPKKTTYTPNYGENRQGQEYQGGREMLVLLAMIFHAFDAFIFGFEINAKTIISRALMYATLAIITHAVLKEHDAFGAIKEYGFWALIPVFFIPVFYYLLSLIKVNADFAHNISAVILAIPIYLIYLMYMKGCNHEFYGGWDFLKNIVSPISWAKVYFIFLVFLVIFSAITLFPQVTELGETPRIAINEGGKAFVELTKNTWTKVSEAITGTGGIIKDRYWELWNQSMGERYTGQVEDEYRARAKVEITNFELKGQKYYEGVPVFFFPIISARSFGDDRLRIDYNCTAYNVSNKSQNVKGNVNPNSPIIIEKYDDVGTTCEFNTDTTNMLSAGSYIVEVNARFEFETWAYTRYAFMEKSYANSVRAGGDDVNIKFDVPRNPPAAIYTGGPVMLGMNQNINLPISVDYSKGASFPVGMTLENKEISKGEIINVKEFKLYVPSAIEVSPGRCTVDSTPTRTTDPDTGYNVYSFSVPPNRPKQSYLTMDCAMMVSSANVNNLLADPNGVTGATIMGKVKYEYVLKETKRIRINKDPYYNAAPTPATT